MATVHIVILIIAICVFAAAAPRAFRVAEVLILAPIIGIIFGGFAWSVAALAYNPLITTTAFATFLCVGVLASMAVFAKAS